MPVDALSRDQSRKLASGTLLTVDNSIDTTTGTVKLKAEFDNADASLFPNQFVNVRMLVDTLHDATVVPSAAVQRGTQGKFVYVVGTDNVVKLSVVKLGPVDGETTVIDKGVATGDVVVIDGTDRLREGQTVETVSRDTTIVPTGAPKGRNGKGAGNGQGRRAKGGATESAPAAPRCRAGRAGRRADRRAGRGNPGAGRAAYAERDAGCHRQRSRARRAPPPAN